MRESLKKGDGIPFTQIKNSVLTSANLTFKAKGLYAYLYSKPHNWNFSSYRITKETYDGRLSILSGLKELEQAGYLTRDKRTNGQVTYTIWLKPQFICEPKPKRVFRTVGSTLPAVNAPISNRVPDKQRKELPTNTATVPVAREKATLSSTPEADRLYSYMQASGLAVSDRRTSTDNRAAVDLIAKHGLAGATSWIDYSVRNAEDGFCPTVTSLNDLKIKIPSLKKHQLRQRQNGKSGMVVTLKDPLKTA